MIILKRNIIQKFKSEEILPSNSVGNLCRRKRRENKLLVVDDRPPWFQIVRLACAETKQ